MFHCLASGPLSIPLFSLLILLFLSVLNADFFRQLVYVKLLTLDAIFSIEMLAIFIFLSWI